MGFYTEYLDRNLDFQGLTQERKNQLRRISELRGKRDILVYASDLTKNAPTLIDYSDILLFQDQLSNLSGEKIDIIIETPGGFAEVVEDLVRIIRNRYQQFSVIVPGYAKSAGTIFTMAADEILMGSMSALGPIDAQIMFNNKKFSADAFLEGLEKIKEEVLKVGKLNPAYIPILQNISPGEIQHCENAQNFSKQLVHRWLAEYKFKDWKVHSSTGAPVTDQEKVDRALQIADELCKHSNWLTHGRSIKINDLEKLKLRITDYSKDPTLNEAITRYYTLLRMSFDTNIYKICETINSQIYRFSIGPKPQSSSPAENNIAIIDFECPKCNGKHKIQANIGEALPLKEGLLPFPVLNNVFKCPNCNSENNLTPIRHQIESQTGKKIVE